MELQHIAKLSAAESLRRAADVVEACAVSDETDALLVLWARMIERRAMGTMCSDEVAALVKLTVG